MERCGDEGVGGDRPLIRVVERHRHNRELLVQFLGRQGFRPLGVESLEPLGEVWQGGEAIALALVDVSGLGSEVWDYCRRLREAAIPFLVISPRQVAILQGQSLAHGASGMLVKPLVSREMLGLVRSLLEG